MVEIIEALNSTSAARTFFYVVSSIIVLGIVVQGIVEIVKYLRK